MRWPFGVRALVEDFPIPGGTSPQKGEELPEVKGAKRSDSIASVPGPAVRLPFKNTTMDPAGKFISISLVPADSMPLFPFPRREIRK
jgi:hypothetical protein